MPCNLESYVEIIDFITHNSFSNRNNQVLYKCVEKVLQSDAELDIPAMLSFAAEQLNLTEVVKTEQQLDYIRDLMDYPVKKQDVIHFAAQVKKFGVCS